MNKKITTAISSQDIKNYERRKMSSKHIKDPRFIKEIKVMLGLGITHDVSSADFPIVTDVQLIAAARKNEYDKNRAELEMLIEADPAVGTPESELLSVLALAVEEYEKGAFFFGKPTPPSEI